MFNGLMLQPLISIVEKQLTDDKTSEIYSAFLAGYPVKIKKGEYRNIITISQEPDGKIYLCIVGLDRENRITEAKYQTLLSKGISELLTAGKKLKENE